MITFVLSSDEKNNKFANWNTSVDVIYQGEVPRRGDKLSLCFGEKAEHFEVTNVTWTFDAQKGIQGVVIELERE